MLSELNSISIIKKKNLTDLVNYLRHYKFSKRNSTFSGSEEGSKSSFNISRLVDWDLAATSGEGKTTEVAFLHWTHLSAVLRPITLLVQGHVS